MQYLIDKKSIIDSLDDTESTPLILAASSGRTEVVKLLISNGANVNHTTNLGHSSLQYSCSKGWKEVCFIPSSNIYFVFKFKYFQIVEILLENNADINIADVRGATPLHRAASKGNYEIVKTLLKYKDKLKIDFRDIYGNTPLHLACEEDRQEEAKLLIEHGASLEVHNLDKKTPLDLCSHSLLKLVKSLTKKLTEH